MKRLLVLLSLIICLPATAQVRVFHAITGPAKIYNSSQGKTSAQWVADQIALANAVSAASGSTVQYTSAGFSEGKCCGADAGDTGHIGPDASGTSALHWAMNSPAVFKGREDSSADVVVVVATDSFGTDAPYASMMDCSKTGEAAARRAVVGVNANRNGPDSYVAALGLALCAGEYTGSGSNRGYYYTTGTNASNCKNWSTFLAPIQTSLTVTATFWRVVELGLHVSGDAPTADGANAAMVALCPNAPGNYTCTTAGSCVISGSAASCPHWQNPPPPASPNLITGISNGTLMTETFTCNTYGRIQAHSANGWRVVPPGATMLLGDATHDNASAMSAKYAGTQLFRNFKFAAKLMSGAGLLDK